ncbi:autotransporter domain-containing protein [Escherichia coli]|nr:autotransporter domain-containing protein [Escherichia coli]
MVIRKKKCWDCGNAITHNTVCCPYCGSVDPFGYYRNTDRIVTILLALIIVVLLTTVSVSVYILCIRTFSSRGDMSMGTAAAGSNMTFSPSRNGTSLDLQAGLEARVRENITLGVQAGYAHSVSGSSAEGYNGQATLNVTF